ncbi:MAG: thioredoxin-dependent thiol peroxidase [Calditrichaceae bacterium]
MLDVGKKAPDFILPNQEGKSVSLSSHRGKWVVLYFYPKDMTPGCTTEACNFQESLPDFKSIDAVILGISKDSVERHKKFANKHDLEFHLLSDDEGNVCETYGTWQLKKLYGREFMGIVRSTYLIDPDGVIAKVYPKVKVKEHHTELLNDIQSLG